MAHSCPGCPVALATIDEDELPTTGKVKMAVNNGIDVITTVIGSTANEVTSVVE